MKLFKRIVSLVLCLLLLSSGTFSVLASAAPLACPKCGGTESHAEDCELGKMAALFGMRGVELASILIVFGAPTAVASVVMAQQMDSDADLATQAVVFTTAFSAATVFLFVFALKSFGLL